MITMLLIAAQPVGACTDERTAVAEMADAIEKNYVLEQKAVRAADALRDQVRSGQLDQHCDDPAAFAKAMTAHLRAQIEDDHIYVEYAPHSQSAGEDDWLEKWRAEAPARAFGVRRVERLDGNIAYIHLTSFYELAVMEKALGAAFRLVEGSAGLILDLRDNPGGSPESEWPVQWTFMNAGSPLPLRREKRAGPEPDLAEPALRWPRYGADRPLAIMVNRRTFSAPEAVAYSLQAQSRAVIVGSPSGGGAHMLGEAIALSGGWKIGVPDTRPYSPHTGGNWERTGVIPDIIANDDEAIAKASAWLIGRINEKGAAPQPETAP